MPINIFVIWLGQFTPSSNDILRIKIRAKWYGTHQYIRKGCAILAQCQPTRCLSKKVNMQ